jgi:hypothetical protein
VCLYLLRTHTHSLSSQTHTHTLSPHTHTHTSLFSDTRSFISKETYRSLEESATKCFSLLLALSHSA